ncbi:MAG: hypothetical protein GFH27_549301n297 [Chloroflexi bacterium AL-W]|nr:hypothetical protein [Chloroflexi bacterium AL-N1]NOK68491.1 hypothetical protein [Chloroflexi bacterium AL-N10]NOK74137.1 hypothetical protein [Chloroflexi bacterium AL-N5]NOK83104.1 hypothetical protein [Chloroflexi bacterium AL-W]NOK90627.1 hypothetical protein [Chloroflexi bacterium AL-N15]
MPGTDKRNRLNDDVFSYQESKDDKVFISWHGKPVKTLRGKEAQKFLARISGLEHHEAQLVMAKVTGNFKRGNEASGS